MVSINPKTCNPREETNTMKYLTAWSLLIMAVSNKKINKKHLINLQEWHKTAWSVVLDFSTPVVLFNYNLLAVFGSFIQLCLHCAKGSSDSGTESSRLQQFQQSLCVSVYVCVHVCVGFMWTRKSKSMWSRWGFRKKKSSHFPHCISRKTVKHHQGILTVANAGLSTHLWDPDDCFVHIGTNWSINGSLTLVQLANKSFPLTFSYVAGFGRANKVNKGNKRLRE